MRLIDPTHSTQFMEWHNSGITTLKRTICAPNVFKTCRKNKYYLNLTSSNFVTISHINYWDQVNSWAIFWKFWNDPLCRNKSVPFPLLNVVAYCQNINTEACAKKLPQTLTNNIDHGKMGIVLRIYVRYYRRSKFKSLLIYFEEDRHNCWLYLRCKFEALQSAWKFEAEGLRKLGVPHLYERTGN